MGKKAGTAGKRNTTCKNRTLIRSLLANTKIDQSSSGGYRLSGAKKT